MILNRRYVRFFVFSLTLSTGMLAAFYFAGVTRMELNDDHEALGASPPETVKTRTPARSQYTPACLSPLEYRTRLEREEQSIQEILKIDKNGDPAARIRNRQRLNILHIEIANMDELIRIEKDGESHVPVHDLLYRERCL